MTEETLYEWYTDENHKYNTIIWQFPTAIIGLNILAINGIYSNISALQKQPLQLIIVLLFMWVLNMILLYTVAKHAFHQRCFTTSLTRIQKKLIEKNPDLEPLFVIIEKKGIFKKKATSVLVKGLFILNLGYLVYLIYFVIISL